MAGPDSKRLYLCILAQDLDKIKSERAYWNKNLVSTTASGAGTKYTALQAAMLLTKLQVVHFLVKHPSTDLSVKASDGRTTLMIAAQSNMPVSVLQKILEKYDLKTINECDPKGKTALDLAEPGSETYEFLASAGCQTKAARDACLQGFFVSAGKHAVHQRIRKKSEAGDGRSSSCPPAESDKRSREKQHVPSTHRSEGAIATEGSCNIQDKGPSNLCDDSSAADDDADREEEEERKAEGEGRKEEEQVGEEEQESPWQLFDDPEDLLQVLQGYLETWGTEGEEGELCQEWVAYLKKKMKKNAASAAVTKWNDMVVSLYGKENVTVYKGHKRPGGAGCSVPPGRSAGKEAETTSEKGVTARLKASAGDSREGDSKLGGKKHTEEAGDESAHKGGTCSAAVKNEKQKSENSSALAGEDLVADGSEKVEQDSDGPERAEEDISRSTTIPESLRGFFDPQRGDEAVSDATPRRSGVEGDRRRTLGVWINKADARERFAEVLPKGKSTESRRRHKKGSRIDG